MDWLGAGLSLVGTWLLARHRMAAMYVYMVSSVVFMTWALTITPTSWAVVSLQVVLICFNIRTIIIWRKEHQ